MLVRHIDAAHPLIFLPDHPHHLGGLDEVERLGREQQLSGDAARIATSLSGEPKAPLASEHLVIRVLHLLGSPRLEDRVLGVADVVRHLSGTGLIAMERMGRILPDRPAAESPRRVYPAHTLGKPGEFAGGEVWNRSLHAILRKRGGG